MSPGNKFQALLYVGLAISIIINLFLASKERKSIGKNKGYEARLKTIKPIHTIINAVLVYVFGVLGAMAMARLYNALFDMSAL